MAELIEHRQRERVRREILRSLSSISVGDPKAVPLLIRLDEIGTHESVEMPIEAVSQQVMSEKAPGREYFIVRFEKIPEPWRTRFAEASRGSTQPMEGIIYERDWYKFLRLWQQEMSIVTAHQNAHQS
jgi:hypothetical protein